MLRCLWVALLTIGQVWALHAQTRPNIVLIVADDHGREAVGCYGNTFVKTPDLDRLAADGTWFAMRFVRRPVAAPAIR